MEHQRLQISEKEKAWFWLFSLSFSESHSNLPSWLIIDIDTQIFFVTGGTQTNQLSSVLQNYQGVIAATIGHVSVHEAGAIEYTDHKVLTLSEKDGKLSTEVIKSYLENFYADEKL